MNRGKPITEETHLMISKKRTKKYSKILATFFLLLISLSVIQVLSLQLFHNYKGINIESYKDSMYENTNTLVANRGIISDSQGRELAVNINTYDMYAILNPEAQGLGGEPDFVSDKTKTQEELLKILGLEKDKKAIDLFSSQFASQAKQIEFSVYGKGLSLTQKRAIEELKLTGIKFNEKMTRYYPFGDYASYAIGYAKYNDEGVMVGEIGIEGQLDGYLRGEDGKIIQSLDAHGVPISGEEARIIQAKSDGTNVQLTIDATIQSYIQEVMDEKFSDKKYDMGYTIATDAKTNAILGMYSLPSYDPNIRDVKNYTNPFTSYCFEPGSTIKTFLVADAMKKGVWNPNTITKTGSTTRPEWGGYIISDWIQNDLGFSWGNLEWDKGYFVSSNTVVLDILDDIGNESWNDSLTNEFKFGQKVKIPYLEDYTLACDVSPTVPIEYATSSFGQGFTSNALQVMQALSVISNNGKIATPHLIKSLSNPETGEVFYESSTDESLVGDQVLTSEQSKEMLKLMEQVITYREDLPGRSGSAKNVAGTAFPIASKSGTAQIAADGTYSSSSGYNVSYTTIAPSDDPLINIYTVVVNPKDATKYVAETTRDIAIKSVDYLSRESKGLNLEISNNRYVTENYVGIDIKEMEKILKDQGIKVIILGEGNVIKQFPTFGQVVSKDETIVLRAEGEEEAQILINKSRNEVTNICNAMDWDCTLTGVGIASNVVSEGVSVNVEFTLPEIIANRVKKEENDERIETSSE